MSLEPYDYSQFPPGDDEFDEPMQMHGGSSWQPGWCPPNTRPPGSRPPPWPPGPGHGGWPFWGYWGFRLRSAWRDVKFLNKLIGDIINEQIDNGIIAPGPNSPVPGPNGGTTGGSTTPSKGVTDGSDASPGTVGEFVLNTVTTTWSINSNATQTQTVTGMVAAPGDWDIQAQLFVNFLCEGGLVTLDPAPTGLSPPKMAVYNTAVETMSIMTLTTPMVRLNISVPTLLPFRLALSNVTAATVSGNADLTVWGRRRR